MKEKNKRKKKCKAVGCVTTLKIPKENVSNKGENQWKENYLYP